MTGFTCLLMTGSLLKSLFLYRIILLTSVTEL